MIRLDMGIELGCGKSKTIFDLVVKQKKFLIYSPLTPGLKYGKGGHPSLDGIPIIEDSKEWFDFGFENYWKQANGFAVPCGGDSEIFFQELNAQRVSNFTLCLDDFAGICSEAHEKTAFKKFMVNQLSRDIPIYATGHYPGDFPFKIRNAATDLYWHGPLNGKYLENLVYSLHRIDMTEEFFKEKVNKHKKFDVLRIR